MKFRFKDWKTVLIMFVVSILLTIVAFYSNLGFLKFLNVISWIVFAFLVYKDAFSYINSLDMSNDLYLWILRIVGGILSFIGLIFGGIMFFGGLIQDSDPLTMGVSIMFFGLGFLGVFMIFRSKRRYSHLYINR